VHVHDVPFGVVQHERQTIEAHRPVQDAREVPEQARQVAVRRRGARDLEQEASVKNRMMRRPQQRLISRPSNTVRSE